MESKEINYITPQLEKYQNIDDLLKNNNHDSWYGSEKSLTIDDLIKENFVCIVGEPGIGKSRLLEEIKKKISQEPFSCKASEFTTMSIPKENEYCIIDALDEVEGYLFYNVLQSIKHYKKENPKVKVLFTCRKHYVASYARHFADCDSLTFIEINRLRERDVINIVDQKCSDITKGNINKSPKLKELIRIPRYLTFLLEYSKRNRNCSNIGELFEYMIDCSINTAIKDRKSINKNESFKILIKRVLEKVAFVMEISRKDQITKDELYTILDGIRGNMTQMFIANFDLLFFESRILKNTDRILQFENTELQEYLAAIELCRQDNIESVIYDVAVHKELQHIYPNWYDIIPHLSYTKGKIHTFINVLKLIISYESNLENESFENILKYVDPSALLFQQKEELFSIIFEHYQRTPSYIMWKGTICNLLQECYTSRNDAQMIFRFEQLNKIQLSNIYVVLDATFKANKLSKCVSDYWTKAASVLMETGDSEKQLAALDFYDALECKNELIQLSTLYSDFTKELKEKYCEITGYGKFTENDVIDCWLTDCYSGNPYAINAVLLIEDLPKIIYAYSKIIENGKLYEFFNKKGALAIMYESHLYRQTDIAWTGNTESKVLITQIIASYISNNSYYNHSQINLIIKKILLEEITGVLFITSFDKDWELEYLFQSFDAELIDYELLSSLDKLMLQANIKTFRINNILIKLTNKIRGDKDKRNSIVEYIDRYAATFNTWDEESIKAENEKTDSHNQQLIKVYKVLLEPKTSKYKKYEAAFKLSDDIEFVKKQEHTPLIDIIKAFFEELDLDKMILERKTHNSFTLSWSLPKIPAFIKVLYHLGINDLLNRYRITLAKTLPYFCVTRNYDTNEIRDIYKSVIGSISDDEKQQLVKWWKDRKDDFMNISSDDICMCITDYGIDALYYKLEEYIKQYIECQDLDHSIAASKALDIISKRDYGWDITKYKELFDSLKKDEGITSIKMQCNAIMIEKFQDSDAIKWRIEYLKNNVIETPHNETGHARAISIEESEIISPNPKMFRCFMEIKDNEKLASQMMELFDEGLKLCKNPDTQEYASYLLNQIYYFFVDINEIYYMSNLRNKVKEYNKKSVSYLATKIMNNAEMLFMRNVKANIGKAIKLYNKCIDDSHLNIRNDGDLIRYFDLIYYEVQKEIQDQGIYTLVRTEALSEDFIQRELKNTIINKCCQMGLEIVRIDREITLQDNKRTDLIIRYGLCKPIMIELKLLHNKEIQNKKERVEYKKKFIQYINATNPCLSVFWVFDVHREDSNRSKFEELKFEYNDLLHTSVLLTDCICSSGIETGLPQENDKKQIQNKKREKKS